MNRPRLTAAVVRGLGHVEDDARGQVEEREGWGECPPRHADEWRALEYIRALIQWYEQVDVDAGAAPGVEP